MQSAVCNTNASDGVGNESCQSAELNFFHGIAGISFQLNMSSQDNCKSSKKKKEKENFMKKKESSANGCHIVNRNM